MKTASIDRLIKDIPFKSDPILPKVDWQLKKKPWKPGKMLLKPNEASQTHVQPDQTQ